MSTAFFTPWQELERGWPFSRQHDPQRNTGGSPKVNVWNADDHVVLTAELPGLNADSIGVNVHDNVLTLSGLVPAQAKEEGVTYHRNERCYGKFSRQFRLPFRADGDKTTAELKLGVLKVTVHSRIEDQPRQIAVKAC